MTIQFRKAFQSFYQSWVFPSQRCFKHSVNVSGVVEELFSLLNLPEPRHRCCVKFVTQFSFCCIIAVWTTQTIEESENLTSMFKVRWNGEEIIVREILRIVCKEKNSIFKIVVDLVMGKIFQRFWRRLNFDNFRGILRFLQFLSSDPNI